MPPHPLEPRLAAGVGGGDGGGGLRPFLLSFNLTFPANGQPGVNSTALIATRTPPPSTKGWKTPPRASDPPQDPTVFPPFFFASLTLLARFLGYVPHLPSYLRRGMIISRA